MSVVGGTNQTFKITPATGYKIANVLVDNASVGAEAVYLYQRVGKSQHQRKFYSCDLHVDYFEEWPGSGTVTSSPTGPTYNAGASVTLAAAAGVNSTFTGWSGACSGKASSCTVVMTGNAAVTATFNSTRGVRSERPITSP